MRGSTGTHPFEFIEWNDGGVGMGGGGEVDISNLLWRMIKDGSHVAGGGQRMGADGMIGGGCSLGGRVSCVRI